MSVTVLSRPIKNGSPFNAVGNPIVYTLRREDNTFDSINNSTGNASLVVNGNQTAYYNVGETVYINAPGYNLVTTILAVNYTGANTLLRLNTPFVSSVAGTVNNLSDRLDYKIAVKVFGMDGIQIGSTLEFSPYTDGIIKINVALLLRSYLGAEWANIVGTNDPEPLTSKEFYISCSEFYDGVYGSYVNDGVNIVAVFAAMQLMLDTLSLKRNANGGNMLDFMPGSADALWLSRYAITGDPVPMWRDYPFSLSFIWPDGVATIKRKVVQKTANGEILQTNIDALETITDNNIHRMTLPAIHADTDLLEVTLLNGADAAITSTLIIEVKQSCKNPVHLFWKNSLGGDTYYQFEFDQEYGYSAQGDKKSQRMTLFASDLRLSAWEALNELNSPSEVFPKVINDLYMDDSINKTAFRDDQQAYILNADGTIKLGVVVIEESVKTRTRLYKHSIEINIELPAIFVI